MIDWFSLTPMLAPKGLMRVVSWLLYKVKYRQFRSPLLVGYIFKEYNFKRVPGLINKAPSEVTKEKLSNPLIL